jgi:hypothetical protein
MSSIARAGYRSASLLSVGAAGSSRKPQRKRELGPSTKLYALDASATNAPCVPSRSSRGLDPLRFFAGRAAHPLTREGAEIARLALFEARTQTLSLCRTEPSHLPNAPIGTTLTPSGRRYAYPVLVMTTRAAGGPQRSWSTRADKFRSDLAAESMALTPSFTSTAAQRPSRSSMMASASSPFLYRKCTALPSSAWVPMCND